MPEAECKPLLDACGVSIYERNAFRLLGVDVDQSVRQIKRRERELRAAAEVDDLADEYPSELRPQPLPSIEELLEAVRALTDPQYRFIHEFFWFWPLDWGRSQSDPALRAIKDGDADKALRHWKSLVASQHVRADIARHNLAVLGHFSVLARERRILNMKRRGVLKQEEHKKLDSAWKFAFTHWEAICADPVFWSTVAERVETLNDPRLTHQFLQQFRRTLPIAFDNINADMAVAYCNRSMFDRASHHVQIMKDTNPGEDNIEVSLRRVTRPLHDRIEHAITSATSKPERLKTEGDKVCRELIHTVESILAVLRTLLGKHSPEFTETSDRVAESMLQCQIAYGNATEDWVTSKILLEATLKVARGAQVRERIQSNLDILTRNLEVGLCWFCQQNSAREGHAMRKQMHKKLYIEDARSGQHPDLMREVTKLRSQYPYVDVYSLLRGKVLGTQSCTLSIQRCETCHRIHRLGAQVSWTVGLGVPGVCTAIGILIGADGSGAAVPVVFGVPIGILCAMGILPAIWAEHGIQGPKHWRRHEAYLKLKNEGWSEGPVPTTV